MGKIGLIFLVLLGSGTFRSLRKPKGKTKRNNMRIYNCTGEKIMITLIPKGPKDGFQKSS